MSKLPSIAERLVVPESGNEMMDGRVLQAFPADPEHGDRQCRVGYVLSAGTAPGYVASTELLTRTDACIRKGGIDPATGERYLEELSFEVKHTQSLRSLTQRARKLVARGVRRVFIIYVAKGKKRGEVIAGPVKEWRGDGWVTLAAEDEIVDRCLRTPIKVQALLDDIAAHDAVAKALIAGKNPAVVRFAEDRYKAGYEQGNKAGYEQGNKAGYEQGNKAGYEQGRVEALREAVLDLCEALAVSMDGSRRARVKAMSEAELGELRAALKAGRPWPGEP